jgi:hypothetical protein
MGRSERDSRAKEQVISPAEGKGTRDVMQELNVRDAQQQQSFLANY